MAYRINLTIKSTNLALIPLLEFVAENTQRNKQKFYANTPFINPRLQD